LNAENRYRIKKIVPNGKVYVIYVKRINEPIDEIVYERKDNKKITKIWAKKYLIDNDCRIKKMESIGNRYVIYTQKKCMIKIVSKVDSTVNYPCTKIKRGKTYNLILRSMFDELREAGRLPVNYLDIPCYCFDGNASCVCIEPKKGIYDLHFCDNLKGLCLKFENTTE
jgi:hypothetical protein